MKTVILLASVFLLSYVPLLANPNTIQFDIQLNEFVVAFKNEILDLTACEKIRNEIKDLVLDIERESLQESKYESEDIIALKQLKKDGDALERFIGVLGNCGHYYLTIEMFELANIRFKGTYQIILQNDNNLNVIAYNIEGYQFLFFENNSEVQYRVHYKWKEIDGFKSGDGTLGILKSSITNIIDNRFNPEAKFYIYDIKSNER